MTHPMTHPQFTDGTAHALAALDGDELSTLAARLGRGRRPIADLLLEAIDEGRVNTGWITDYDPGDEACPLHDTQKVIGYTWADGGATQLTRLACGCNTYGGNLPDDDPGTAALLAVATLATNDGDAAWSLYHRIIGVTTDPGLADTLDTIADGQDDDLGQVLAAAARRLRRQPIGHEAICCRCGETFNPDGPGDLEHIAGADGQPCGGTGTMTGSWS